MDRRRSTRRSRKLLLLLIQCTVFVHLWSRVEAITDINSHTQRADQATHGRLLRHQTSPPTIQEASDREETYGLRIEPAETKRGKTKGPAATSTPPRAHTVRRVINSNEKSDTAKKPQTGNDDTMVMADAGGKSSGSDDGDKEEKKTLAQQVADGKYGLIQELLPKRIVRPGIISYTANSEVPGDNAENLGGLGQEDIWLAEDHVLVLAGGGFRDKGGGPVQPWPPIDDYKAPRRQVKIPSKPSVPPPFPVQLREGEPVKLIGIPFHQYPAFQGNYPTGRGSDPWAGNGSLPGTPPHNPPTILEPGLRYPEEPIHHNTPSHPPPYLPPHNFTASQENVTFDEDDPSLYYPPPYDFYYPHDNTTEIPPGPLVPGIVLPPPPDFFSPLDETPEREAVTKPSPPPRKPQSEANMGYRQGIPPENNKFPTSTPGPKYLPVTPRPAQEITHTNEKQRLASLPIFPTKESVQITSNHAIYTQKFSPIADSLTPSVNSSGGGEKERLPEVRYPAKSTGNLPLYYYDGSGIPELVVTPSPELLHDYYKEVSPPQKSNKDHIIYIFTSPDFNSNQVPSTEYPQTLKDSNIYQYSFEDNRQGKSQYNKQRYRTDVPTPPRIENFHDVYTTSAKNDQHHNSPSQNGPNSGFHSPEDVSISDEINVTSNPSNYFYQDNNTQDQHYEKIGQRIPQQPPNPLVYYSIASTSDQDNSTREGYWEVSTQKPLVQLSLPVNAYSLESHQKNYDSNPTYYKQPQDYLTYNRGQEAASVIDTKSHQNAGIYRGTFPKQTPLQGVNVITVKPAVLYAGSASANNNNNIHSEVSTVTSHPETDYYSYTDNRNLQRNAAQKQLDPSITIVTSKPYIYATETPLNNGEANDSNQAQLYSAGLLKSNNRVIQSSERSTSPLRARNSSQPSSVTRSPAYSSLDDPRVHRNGLKVRVSSVGSSTHRPRQQYIHQEVVTPIPHYQTTPRSPKYITTPSGRQVSYKIHKKPPMAQYQEYFEAAINSPQPSHLSQSGNYQGEYERHVLTTESPAYQIKDNTGGQQSKFNVYSPHVTTLYTQRTQYSPTHPTGIASNVKNPHTQYKLDTSGVLSSPSKAIQSDRYISQTHLAQDNSYRQGQIYGHTTPRPVYYQYPENKNQNYNNPLNLGSDFSSAFSFPSSTVSPLPAYYTTHDVNLFDEATKNYFNVFGQKISDHGESRQQYQQTTPLPPQTSESNDQNRQAGRYIYTPIVPTKEFPQQQSVLSLEDDIRVNFQNPLPPINPNSESILQRTLQPSPAPPVQEGTVVSYQLPGVDGKGAAGGSHYFFLTPQPVSPDTRPRNFQVNPYRKQPNVAYQGQRPVSYWTGYTSR